MTIDRLGQPSLLTAPLPRSATSFNPATWKQNLTTPSDFAMWIAGPGAQKMWKELFDEIPADQSYLLELAITDTYEGWPLVFYAVQGTRVNIVDYCLCKGGNPNVTTPHGIPLLAFAILTCNHESVLNIVKAILKHGADTSYLEFD